MDEQAWRTAHRWLDGRVNSFTDLVPGDPDCDGCVLARQYLHALDKIAQQTARLERLEAVITRYLADDFHCNGGAMEMFEDVLSEGR
jgi:hypothetical protein